MLRSKKNKSVVNIFRDRELNNSRASPYFLSLSAVSQLIRSDSRYVLSNYSEKTAKGPITYDTGYVYLSQFCQFSSIYGKNYTLSPFYELEKTLAKKKVSDVISYSIPVYKDVDATCRCSSKCTCLSQYLLSISEDNWLCQHLMVNGKLIRQIYANRFLRGFRFKYCDWDVYSERIVLTSTLNTDPPGHQKSPVVVNLAIFTTYPFEFVALLEIKRSVFGEHCSAANISDQHLIVGMGLDKVHIYSFVDFLNEGDLTPYKIGDTYRDGKVGMYPTGLPLNFNYKHTPPLLFNVQCSGQIVRFGGYPYHYITKNAKTINEFTVTNIETNTSLVGGPLQIWTFNDDMDAIQFHPDHSNRLILKSDTTVDCYKLVCANGVSWAEKLFTMGFFEKAVSPTEISRFGRKIKRRMTSFLYHRCTIFCTDYASDLDLFAILGVHESSPTEGFVKLYDSVTGEEVRTLKLRQSVCESNIYELYVDMGSVIIIERKLQIGYAVYVYSL